MKEKGVGLVFLLFGLAALGLVGFFMFGAKNKPVSQTPTPTPLLQRNYQDKTFGFEIADLDANLEVVEQTEQDYFKIARADFRKNFTSFVGYEPPKFLKALVVKKKAQSLEDQFASNPLTLWIFENPQNLNAEVWFEKYWYYPFLWGIFAQPSKGHVAPNVLATVSGQLTKQVTVSYQPQKPTFIYLPDKDKMFLFRVIDKDQPGSKLLKSFKLHGDF